MTTAFFAATAIALLSLVIVIAVDTIYIPDFGTTDDLAGLIGKAAPTSFSTGKLRLFSNNVTVSKTTTLGSLTELVYSGYAAITLAPASWNTPSVSAHVSSTTPVSAFVFTLGAGAGVTVYGAYITDSGNTQIEACWNFGASGIVVPVGGATISITPTLTTQSLN